MNGEQWKSFIDEVDRKIPTHADRLLAQNILHVVFKNQKKFALAINAPENCDYNELIFVFDKHVSLLSTIPLFFSEITGVSRVYVDAVTPKTVRIEIKIPKHAGGDDSVVVAKNRPALTIKVAESVKKGLWMSNEDRNAFDIVALYCINIGSNQSKVQCHVHTNAESFTVVCNNVSDIDFTHLYWMLQDIGPARVLAIELVSANTELGKPCSLDVTIKHTGTPPDAKPQSSDEDDDYDDDIEDEEEEEDRRDRKRKNHLKPRHSIKKKSSAPWFVPSIIHNWFSTKK